MVVWCRKAQGRSCIACNDGAQKICARGRWASVNRLAVAGADERGDPG